MVRMNGIYRGEKHCDIVHESSQSQIETDAPKDNHGRGESFSPTDLIGASLGSCILTTMAILTEKEDLKLEGSQFQIEKIMESNPRRISVLNVSITLPESLSEKERSRLEEIARTCPVQKSLHPDLRVNLIFHYTL